MRSITHRKFKVLGSTQDVDTCDCCGRTGLKKTIVLQPLDPDGGIDGDVCYYGTDCASVASGWSHNAIERHVLEAKAENDTKTARIALYRRALAEYAAEGSSIINRGPQGSDFDSLRRQHRIFPPAEFAAFLERRIGELLQEVI